jgi:hypothetical protein
VANINISNIITEAKIYHIPETYSEEISFPNLSLETISER